jgi:hypothetical protein
VHAAEEGGAVVAATAARPLRPRGASFPARPLPLPARVAHRRASAAFWPGPALRLALLAAGAGRRPTRAMALAPPAAPPGARARLRCAHAEALPRCCRGASLAAHASQRGRGGSASWTSGPSGGDGSREREPAVFYDAPFRCARSAKTHARKLPNRNLGSRAAVAHARAQRRRRCGSALRTKRVPDTRAPHTAATGRLRPSAAGCTVNWTSSPAAAAPTGRAHPGPPRCRRRCWKARCSAALALRLRCAHAVAAGARC